MDSQKTATVHQDGQYRTLSFSARWPVNQTGEHTFEVRVPMGGGLGIINEKFADSVQLTEKEFEQAQDAALRAIAVH